MLLDHRVELAQQAQMVLLEFQEPQAFKGQLEVQVSLELQVQLGHLALQELLDLQGLQGQRAVLECRGQLELVEIQVP